MCFYNGQEKNARVAKRDIYCFKVVNYYGTLPKKFEDLNGLTFESMVMNFKYRIGKLYKEDSKYSVLETRYTPYVINSGAFHSYRNAREAILNSTGDYYCFAVLCKIPKGSKYITNSTEIVSDRIKLIDVIASGTEFQGSNLRTIDEYIYEWEEDELIEKEFLSEISAWQDFVDRKNRDY